jgi:hypothetical protein
MKSRATGFDALCTRVRLIALRRIVLALALGLALLGGDAIPAQAQDPPNGLTGTFGESAGSAQVVPATGAMTYTVPFDLPAARGAAQPSLSLRYASGAATGEAGVGWSLDLPSIERAPLASFPKYLDPAPNLGSERNEDRYAYSGRPLTFICTVGGSPACPQSEAVGAMPGWASGYRHYRLQVESSFERFFLHPNRKTWLVQRRGSGEILEFGEPLTNAALTPPAYDVKTGSASVFRWNLVRQHDRHGLLNVVVYNWAGVSPERQYLRDIYYTASGSGANVDEFAYHVELSWELPTFSHKDYAPVDKRLHHRRLRRVAVSSKTWLNAGNRELVRAYSLRYYGDRSVPANAGEAPLWGRSSLQTVTTEGRCNLSEVSGHVPDPTGCPSLPPVSFEYEPAALAVGVATRSDVLGDPAAENGGLALVVSSAVMDIDRNGLPDILQAWPQNFGVEDEGGTHFQECHGENTLFWVVAGFPGPTPRLACVETGEGPVDLRSARDHVAYINHGAGATGSLSLEHHCLDAGDGSAGTMTGYHLGPAGGGRPTALFNQFSAEAVGAWGDAAMLWSVAGYRGFTVLRTTADAEFCSNIRIGATTHPALAWKKVEDVPGAWARYPSSQGIGAYHQIVDIDGDGYADLLTDPTSPAQSTSGFFKRAAVRFTKKITHLEVSDNVPGPALVPFAATETSSDPISIAPFAQDYSTYVDINGDGVVDLLTAQPSVDGGVAHVRPGDGRGGFGCDPSLDVTCVVPNDGPWVGKAYRLFVPDAATPWPLHRYVPYNNGGVDTHFFHDVTGDGLPDIVAYRPATVFPSSEYAPGTLKLWVNVDGRTFRCATGTDCVVATIAGFDQPGANLPKYRVVFTDIDANGSEDFVLLGIQGVWHFSFLSVTAVPFDGVPGTRSPRPGLLTRIRNGVGAETEIVYQTIQELDRRADSVSPA